MFRDPSFAGAKRWIRFLFFCSNCRNIRFHLLNKGISFQGIRINHFSVNNSVASQFFSDLFRMNIIHAVLLIFRHDRRIMHPGLRQRNLHACQGFHHFIEALLLLRSLKRALVDHVADMLFYCRPAQAHFFIGFPSAKLHAAGIVVYEATAAVQEGMAVPTDAVFTAQENPGIHRSRILRVQGSYAELSAFKAAASAQYMVDFLVRKRKHGAFSSLRADGSMDADGIHRFDLFFFTGKQGKLFHSFVYA